MAFLNFGFAFFLYYSVLRAERDLRGEILGILEGGVMWMDGWVVVLCIKLFRARYGVRDKVAKHGFSFLLCFTIFNVQYSCVL